MQQRAAVALGALVLLGGLGLGAGVEAEPGPDVVGFGPEVAVSSERIGEPGIKVGPDGTVYVHAPGRVWRSTDEGATFTKLPFAFGVNPCGCDADVAVDEAGNVFYSDLAANLGCIAIAATMDQGAHWIPNPLACGFDTGFVDRQWIESDGGSNLYATFYGPAGATLVKAVAAPLPVFVNLQSGFSGVDFIQWNGYLAVDRNSEAIYLTYNTQNDQIVVHRSLDGGLTLQRVVVAARSQDTFDSFTVPAVDDAGNVYIVWTERVNVGGANVGTDTYYAYSTDQGATWSAPLKINKAPFTTTYPWIVAGSDGRVGIVYYGSASKSDPEHVPGDWYVYYAFSADGHSAAPTFTEDLVAPHKVKTGPICTSGTACGNTREFLDFFAVHMFPDGRAAVAYNDQTNLNPGQNPWVRFAKQTSGPLLRTSAPPPPEANPIQGLPLGLVALPDLSDDAITKSPRTVLQDEAPASRAVGVGAFKLCRTPGAYLPECVVGNLGLGLPE